MRSESTTQDLPPTMRLKEVSAYFSCSDSTIWRLCKNPKFPQPRRLGKRYTYWLRAEVEEFALQGLP